jgi:hypothetical protein
VDSNATAHKGKNILTQSTSTFPTAIITCTLPKASLTRLEAANKKQDAM